MHQIELELQNEELRRAQEELEASRAKYFEWYDMSPVGFFTISEKDLILEANLRGADLLGIERSQLINQRLGRHVAPEDQNNYYMFRKRLLEMGKRQACELRMRRQDGSLFWGLLDSSAVREGADGSSVFRIMLSDITERKRREEELARHRDKLEELVRERTEEIRRAKEELEREAIVRKGMEADVLKAQKLEAVGVLAAGIAHDFNNALTAIINSVKATRMSLPPGDAVSERLRTAESAARNAKALTQQLLTFSKGGSPIKKTLPIGSLIRETARFAVRGSNFLCEFSIPEDLWSADVDGGQISQVISNMIINAEQSMSGGGTINIVAGNVMVGKGGVLPLPPGRYLRISITDHGCGIPEELFPRIFDPYFTTKPEGGGLGLYTSYEIIRKHGGHISVESRVGEGSKFTIFLPASEQLVVENPRRRDAICSCRADVLLLEDDALLADSVLAGLGMFGIKVERAEDGAKALDMYRRRAEKKRPYDAVILDLTIPGGMGGIETVRHLLELDPNVKAIVSSGYSEDPIMTNYSDYGFKGVIPKPYELEELVDMIQGFLPESRLEGP